jgi:hypothetical protein
LFAVFQHGLSRRQQALTSLGLVIWLSQFLFWLAACKELQQKNPMRVSANKQGHFALMLSFKA